jgi:uncharacterized membrane protein (UPF0127 family)
MRLAILSLIAPVLFASCSIFDTPHQAAGLPVETIHIATADGPKAFTVEVAADAASQERGLMFRRDMARDAGMLFDFHQEARVSFWMKNTPLPLDMLFIRADGTVSSVQANAVPYSTDFIYSAEPVRAVLEINAGQAEALGIKRGDRVQAAIFHDVH